MCQSTVPETYRRFTFTFGLFDLVFELYRRGHEGEERTLIRGGGGASYET